MFEIHEPIKSLCILVTHAFIFIEMKNESYAKIMTYDF